MNIKKGKQNEPRRVLIYGDNGIGKSTFAAKFPTPLFLNIEDGAGDIDVDKTERLKTYDDVVGAISWMISNPGLYKTVVIDTADWLQRLIFKEVAKERGKPSIDDIGFSKGYDAAALKWQFLIDGLTHLWKQGLHIVFTAHEKVAKFSDPKVGDSYNYFSPALDERGSVSVVDWCSEVFFATTEIHVVKKEEGFNQKRNVAIGGERRIMFTSQAASHVAKNRLGLPPQMAFDYQELAPFMPQSSGDIGGVVVNGSSKVSA